MSNQNFVVKNGLTVGNTSVINSSGAWVGPSSGLIGATGPQGATGPTGPTGATGAAATWTRVTSTYTASSNQQIIADTSSGAFTITLPGSPATGNVVRITDGYDWSANNLTVARNGSTIETVTDDLVLNIKGVTVELIYDGGTWHVTATVGGVGATGVTGATGPTGATGSASPWTVSSPNIYYTTGNVFVGTTTQFGNAKLSANGNIGIVEDGYFGTNLGSGVGAAVQVKSGSSGYTSFWTNGNERGKFEAAGRFVTSAGIGVNFSGYPNIIINNTDSANYGLMEFRENGTQKAYIGMGGSTQTFSDYVAYSADGFSINTDGAGKLTISNRGASKTIRLCTGIESSSNFETLVLKNGYVNMPTQPRFYAYGVSGGTYVNNSYWIFPSTNINVGGFYNTTNGRFTAPVAGTYVFFHSNIGGTTGDVYRYFLHKNGTLYDPSQFRIDTTASGSEYGTNGSKFTMINLAVNDYVQVRFWSDGGTASYPGTNDPANEYPIFGGYLLG